MSLKLFKYTHHNLFTHLPVFFREKLYKHPSCGGILPMKMTDLVVQRTFDWEGEGGNYYFVDWYPRCRTQDSK